jgi:hypothetical protein
MRSCLCALVQERADVVTTKPCHSKEFPDLDQENADFSC